VPPHIWKTGAALRPYFEDVQRIVANKHKIPEFHGHDIVDMSMLKFEHCPIVDCGITDDSKVISLSLQLVKHLSEGRRLYLHCWGGHGRTGTIVCVMLHLMYGVRTMNYVFMQQSNFFELSVVLNVVGGLCLGLYLLLSLLLLLLLSFHICCRYFNLLSWCALFHR
jgi:protein tyrosine phosphatase